MSDNDFNVEDLVNGHFRENSNLEKKNVSKGSIKKRNKKIKKKKPNVNKNNDVIIGIDLGTTHSCVAIWRNGGLEIIRDENNKPTIPSCVSFTKHNVYIGSEAHRQRKINPESTYYDVKRLIGRKQGDTSVENDLEFMTYDIGYAEDNSVVLKCDVTNRKEIYTPEEISSLILMRLKNMAEEYLKHEVTKAVITVPAYFNDSQREATKHAAEISNLECVRIINEPTAAALAYGLENASRYQNDDLNIVVYDLGGGTLDVSLLTISDGVFEVIASTGNTHLGGEDFDHMMIKYCLTKFQQKHKLKSEFMEEITSIAMQKLKQSCETAKKMLSSTGKTLIGVKDFYDGKDLMVTLTRKMFERICNGLFIMCMKPLYDVLKLSEYGRDEIDEIILVGGSTRIPMIRENIQKFFMGKEPNATVNPDEVVAAGAAIQGYLISHKEDAFSKNVVFLDVIPLSLGVETIGGEMNAIIPRNTHIPCTKNKKYTTWEDNVTSLDIKVYEGERKLTKDNFFLGEFQLKGIEENPRGVPEIKVKFSVDVNGIISVSAFDLKNKDNQNQITVNSRKGGLSSSEIKKLVSDAKKYASDDKLRRGKMRMNLEIEDLIRNITRNITSKECKLKKQDIDNILDDMKELSDWLKEKNYLNRELSEFKNILKKIKTKYTTLIIKNTGENKNVKEQISDKMGTTVFGDEEDEETVFEEIEKQEFGFDDDISREERNEIKNLRQTLNDHCMNLFSILNSDVFIISEEDKTNLKDYLNEILLGIHVKEKLNKLQYVQLINDVNDNCNKIMEKYIKEDKEVFTKNEVVNSITSKKSELEIFCASLKTVLISDHLPLKPKSQKLLEKEIDNATNWIIDEEIKKKKLELDGKEYDTPESEYQARIDKINNISELLSQEIIGTNYRGKSIVDNIKEEMGKQAIILEKNEDSKKKGFKTVLEAVKEESVLDEEEEDEGLTLAELKKIEESSSKN